MRSIWIGIVSLGSVVALAAACNRNNQNEPSGTDRGVETRPEHNAPYPALPPPAAEPGMPSTPEDTEPMSGMDDETERMGGGGGWGGSGGSQSWPGD